MTRSIWKRTTGRGGRAAIALGALCVTAGGGAASASAGSGNGVASKSPAQILAAAQAALRSASGFVVAGTITENGATVKLRIVDGGSSKIELQLTEKAKTADIVVVGGTGYVRANRAFWVAQAGSTNARLADRWIQVPASATKQLSSSLGDFAPSTLATCLGEDVGTLSSDGTTTIDGDAAVVIHDAGNVPGSNAGTLAVATTGPAYPLRSTATGPTRPGGRVDACNNGKGGNVQGSVTLSDFNHAPAIKAPAHPLKPTTSSSSV